VPRSLRFGHRVGLLLLLAAGALIAVTIVTLVLGQRSERQVTGIETRYLPLIELDRDLKRTATATAKALEDAANAAEEAKLAEADRLARELVARIDSGAQQLIGNGSDPRALRGAFETYYAAARGVSAALAAGTPATRLTADLELMSAAQRNFLALLDTAATPDRNQLAAAFSTARDSQREALAIDIAVAVIALAVMALLSWRLIRRTVSSLHAVSDGVERLARGDFATAIDVPTGDEIGELAREANRTAERLRAYREEADREADRARRALVETQNQARAAEVANKELEAFSYSVSHDLRSPLRGIDGFSQALLEDEQTLSEQGQDYLRRIRSGAQRMGELIDDLLRLSRVSRGGFKKEQVDLSAIVRLIVDGLKRAEPHRTVEVVVQDKVTAFADARLVQITLENLLGNAWKFTQKKAAPQIEFGVRDSAEGRVYFVRDNGAGFDTKYADRLFGAFQRLHADKDFPGTGIGLATVQRIVSRHGGRIWADSIVGDGATFQFTLPAADAQPGEPAAKT
jgi:signal transduction histidine kinase